MKQRGFVLVILVGLAMLAGSQAHAATTIGNNVSVGGTLTVTGNVTLSGTLAVTGAATFSDSVSSTIVTTSRHLSVGSTANENVSYGGGDVNVGNKLTVDGEVNASSTMNVTGAVRFYAAVTSDVSVSSTIVTTSRHLSVGSTASANASYNGGDVNVGNRLTIDGAVNASSTLDVTGATRFFAAVTSDVSVSSTIVTTSRHLSVGEFAGNLNVAYGNGDLNVGNRLAVNGAAYASSTMDVTGAVRLYAGFQSNATSSVGGVLTVTGNLNSSGTTFIGSHIIPGSNNGSDLGAFGTALRDVYVSSSLTIGGNSAAVSSTAIRAHISVITPAINLPDAVSSTSKCTSSSAVVSGAALGDTAIVAPTVWDNAFMAGSLTAVVTSTNAAVIMYCAPNNDSDNDPASMTYRIDVWKH